MATNPKFGTAEQAAMFGFPERYCRVVATAINGDDAFVLLDTGSDGRSYLYGVRCRRSGSEWFETGSSNGGGWSQCGEDPQLGMLALFGEAPAGADAIRTSFGGIAIEVLVRDGAFLAVWWNTACPSDDWPRVVAVHVGGAWRSDPAF